MTVALAVESVALVGNPNVGKSTLFNAMTGLHQRVANYAGVTVDAREGTLTLEEGKEVRLLDLPGTNSLQPSAADEAIVRSVLLDTGEDAPKAVIVVLDATNLRRNLFLLSEVVDLGVPIVVALNMVDEARRAGLDVPTERLREALGVPVIETIASQGTGVDLLSAALSKAACAERGWRFEDPALEEALAAAEGATPWERRVALSKTVADTRPAEIVGRYAWITELLHGDANPQAALRERTERLDRVLLHRVWGPLIFLLVMGVVFQSIFAWSAPLMDGIEGAFQWLGAGAAATLPPLLGELGTSLVVDGVIGGVGAVIVFLPQILILFFFLGLLEDTGYMSRVAFLVDRPLRPLGLSGRSFIPLLSSFACAIPGVMATRTIPNRFERLLAIAVAPLMTCSARLPVYTLLIAAFVPATTVAGFLNLQGLILLGLYLAGMTAAALVAFLATRVRGGSRGRLLPLAVELPPYRRPALTGVLLKLRLRGGDFLKRAGTVIFVVSVVLWVLMSFPRVTLPGASEQEQAAYQLRESYAGRLGHGIEPVIRPLGYDWKIGVGLIASFAAREVFVGTMGVVYSVGEADEESTDLRTALQAERHPETGKKVFSLATVFSLLAFYVFALQCGATIAIVRREAGSWRFALGQALLFLVLAYLAALVTYQTFSALGYG